MKLADIVDVFIAGDWGNESLSNDTPNAVFCIRGADIMSIRDHKYTDIPKRYISKRAKETKLLKVGDLVIEKSGGSPIQSTGRITYISEDLIQAKKELVCSNFSIGIRVKSRWNPLYVYYYWQYIYNLGVFFNFESKTSGIKNLRLDSALEAIAIEEIPLEVQNQIVATLSSYDHKIALNRAINHNLAAMAKQLYDYWFVQFDFPNQDGKPYKSSGGKMVWNEKLKREIPEGWEVISFNNLFNLGNGKATPNSVGNVPAYGGNGIIKYVKESNFCSCFIIGRVGANCGSLHYSPINCWVSDNAIAAIPKNQDNASYLLYSLKLYDLAQNKGGSSQPLITHNELKKLYFLYSNEHVIRFCNIINKQLNLYFDKVDEIETLTKQRDELLPLLMNGQVTIG